MSSLAQFPLKGSVFLAWLFQGPWRTRPSNVFAGPFDVRLFPSEVLSGEEELKSESGELEIRSSLRRADNWVLR